MSIADLYESGEMKEKKGAFRNLVMIARADGKISDSEKMILNKMASYLGLSEEQVNDIVANPETYPMNPPSSILDRRERLVDLVRMVLSDGEIDTREMAVMERCAIGLGYHQQDIPFMVNRIQHYISRGMDRNAVIEAMLAEG